MAQNSETIGARIKRYRQLNKMSAQTLADETGLTRSVVTNLENGRRADPTLSELLAISAALRVPVAALVYPVDRPFDFVTVGPYAMHVQAAVRHLVGQDTSDLWVGRPAGELSFDLLAAARLLESARSRLRHVRREVYGLACAFGLDEQLGELLDHGGSDLASSAASQRIQERLPENRANTLRFLLESHDHETSRYEDVAQRFQRLGGTPGVIPPATSEWSDE